MAFSLAKPYVLLAHLPLGTNSGIVANSLQVGLLAFWPHAAGAPNLRPAQVRAVGRTVSTDEAGS